MVLAKYHLYWTRDLTHISYHMSDMFCTPYAYSLNPTHARAYRHHNTNGPCYVTLTSIPGTCVLQLYVILPVKLKKCPLLLSRSMLKLQRSSVAFQIYAQITKILCCSPDLCPNHKDHLLLSRFMPKAQRSSVSLQIDAQITKIICCSPDLCPNHSCNFIRT